MSNSSVRILIIDDNPAIHRDYRKVLEPAANDPAQDAMQSMRANLFGEAEPEAHEFIVDSAYQGQEALQMVRRALAEDRPYALSFVDMRMPPGWDGLETVRLLRQADPAMRSVICTAFSDHTWEQIANQLGQTERVLVLEKPFDPARLREMVVALTDRWLFDRQ